MFVISAYVNPERAQIRDRAVELGARFEGQWYVHARTLTLALFG